ncbi:alpha/beta hydrolase [Caldimonas brevitalea]|uniref:Alpha/beta hydrolase n=2 Tax=Caldimonas brevitalea TaxID=413882 RepID=A0A0G3BPT2_9BURK|nr:alpha/beta hydrolase [Caldimonas brevitalea]
MIAAVLLAACGGGGGDDDDGNAPPPPVVETRAHDSRTFKIDPATLAFPALTGTTALTDRWTGVLNGAGYRIEVPKNWNGKLVMYAHGYNGTGDQLKVTTPSLRRYLIENGYAWAASSYSTNFYDVRAGVEDTNALALAFTKIAAENGRTLEKPQEFYVTGHSMGGHVAAAAVEKETLEKARNKVTYKGAVPMCGVMGDTELFDYFGAYQLAAQHLAGKPATSFPTTDWGQIRGDVQAALFTTFSTQSTAQGEKLKAVVKNLTGGERPIFDAGYRNTALQSVVWGTAFGGDGTINGILNRNVVDTTRFTYQFDADPAVSAEEKAFNDAIFRAKAAEGANAERPDGLRWIPKVNGEIDVPVVTLHTLGDMYVPFSMQQIYRKRVEAKGKGALLAQRAIRAPGHCDFTVAEQEAAFETMLQKALDARAPAAGDDVLDPAKVAAAAYGCTFTVNTLGRDDNPALADVRAALPACP